MNTDDEITEVIPEVDALMREQYAQSLSDEAAECVCEGGFYDRFCPVHSPTIP